MAKYLMWLCCLTAVMFGSAPAALAAYGIADVPNVHLADSTRFVSNPAGVLSDEAVAAIDAALRQSMRATTAEVAVVVIDEADTDDLDRYATDLFMKWGLGKKDRDNGLLVLVSRDQRQAVIRTGRGLEGVLPDAVCSRIIRNVMAPSFREADYDSGTLNAVNTITEVLNDPANADEIVSARRNNAGAGGEEELTLAEFMTYFCWFGLFVALCMSVVWIVVERREKGQSRHKRYDALQKLKMPMLMTGVLGCGVPFLLYLALAGRMKRLRDKPRQCPACGGKTRRLDEVTDNQYLTSPQNTEEELKSVDYDVWLCPQCGTTVVEPYVNHSSQFEPCDLCHTRAARLVRNKVVRNPTVTRQGEGAREYECRHCHNRFYRYYPIAKLPPVVAAPIGGFGGRGGGGGFGGGSFGGGMTMGGGARGGW